MSVDLTSIEYSTKPATLAHLVWLQRAGEQLPNGAPNWEAVLNLIVSRTSLTIEEAGELEYDEIMEVNQKVCEALGQSATLYLIGKSLENA